MAQVGNPWRAMGLASVFVLAACEPGADVAAPLSDAPTVESSVLADEQLVGTSLGDTVAHAVGDSGLESLVLMSGSANDEGVLGAGCLADESEPLPDGDWFAYVLEAANGTFTVDLACVYGPDTDQFAAYSVTDDSRWTNYVVVNDVVEERTVRYAATAQAYLASEGWQPREVRELVRGSESAAQAGARGVWLRVEQERVVVVVQPYSKGVASG